MKFILQKQPFIDVLCNIAILKNIAIEFYFSTVWSYSKMTPPQKYQILDPPSPYVTVCQCFHDAPPLYITKQIDKLFP